MSFRVLVAERNSASRLHLVSILRDHGAETDEATCLDAARRMLAAGRYDLVCADAHLSGSGCFDFPGDLFSSRGMQVIVTADYDNPFVRDQAEACGALAFLPRPYPCKQASSLIRSAMIERRHQLGGAEPPRILMYSHDTIGLGHMRRHANIASEILAAEPEASVLMVVGCPAGLVFDTPPGVDYIKLPSLVKQGRNVWRADKLNITAERTLDLRRRLIREAVGAFAPDLVLVDHVPTGVWGELVPILEELRATPRPPDIVLGLRDILDSPGALARSWQRSGADAAISHLYDEVLVYGSSRVFDTVGAYGIDDLAPGRVRYAGYVAAKPMGGERAAIRSALGVGDRPLVLVAGGGGRDAYPLIAAAVDALQLIPPAERPAAVFVAGPLMDSEFRADIHARAAVLGVPSYDRLPDFPAHVAAADFLLGMAGYNSVVEAVSIGTPALVVPRAGPSAEQTTRAQVFSRLGLIETLSPTGATPEALAERLRCVEIKIARAPMLRTDGARNAAIRLLERTAMRRQRAQSLDLAS